MRLALFLLLASASASAQPADSLATPARRPAWLTVGTEFSYDLQGAGSGFDLVGASIQYHRPLGPEPLVLQVGASSASGFFGGTFLTEVHIAAGVRASTGPIFAATTVGPSLGRVFNGDRRVVVPGLYGAVQAELAVLPFLGLGAEAFVHANAVRPTAGFGVVLAFGRLPGALIPNPPPTPRRPGP